MLDIIAALIECLLKLYTMIFETMLGSHAAGFMVVIFGIIIFTYKLIKKA